MMNRRRCGDVGIVLLPVVLMLHTSLAAAARKDDVEVRAYVNDTCIVADEPFYLPAPADGTSTRALPLIGIVVGKLAELMLRSAVQATAGKISSTAARKDTKYAVARQTNLFRADLDPAPDLNLNARLGCMTIIAGKFKPGDVECADSYIPRGVTPETASLPHAQWRTSRTNDTVENQLRRANVCMDEGQAQSVYESRFEFSEDRTAYRLTNAGYRVNSLLTTTKPDAARSVFYTLEISQPSRDASNEVLSTAWVNVGMVKAGEHVIDPQQAPPQWLRVPALSVEARRAYEEQTRVHLSVSAEIEALERAITRNRRLLSGLEERMAGASKAVVKGLKDEALKTEIQIQTLSAELDARKGEYADLPQKSMEFMPVSIEVGVTEKTSEKRALMALAKVIDSGSGELASVGVAAAAGMITRSIDSATDADPGASIDSSRAAYFDARVALSEGDSSEKQQTLTAARQKYNSARTAIGLAPIQ